VPVRLKLPVYRVAGRADLSPLAVTIDDDMRWLSWLVWPCEGDLGGPRWPPRSPGASGTRPLPARPAQDLPGPGRAAPPERPWWVFPPPCWLCRAGAAYGGSPAWSRVLGAVCLSTGTGVGRPPLPAFTWRPVPSSAATATTLAVTDSHVHLGAWLPSPCGLADGERRERARAAL